MLIACDGCEGFVPDGAPRCPNCSTKATLGRATKAVLVGGMMMTLMACYGGGWDGEGLCDPLDLHGNGTVNGSTADCHDQVGGSCHNAARGERIVQYHPDSADLGRSGTLTLSWTSSLAIAVYVRNAGASELACESSGGGLSLPVASLDELDIVVESIGPTDATFQLSATFQPTEGCGNGVIEGSERCDDANLIDGDGCSSTCSGELCSDAQALEVGTISDDTRYGTAYYSATACGGEGPELVYEYLPPDYGTLRLNVASLADLTSYVTNQCSSYPVLPSLLADSEGEPACTQPVEGEIGKSVTLEVAPYPLWIIVDGKTAADAGYFDLSLDFTPACGNGQIDDWALETCDDGNVEAGDGCSPGCLTEASTLDCSQAPELPLEPSFGSTVGGGHDSSGYACQGPEAIYQFTAPSDGVLTVIVDADHDASIKLMNDCSSGELSLACSDAEDAGDPEVLSVYLGAGEIRYLSIEGVAPEDAGSFELSASFTAE